jgi:hypothetical protein
LSSGDALESDYDSARLVVHALLVLTGRATPEAEILSKVESFPPSLSVEVLLDRPARSHKTIAILGDTMAARRRKSTNGSRARRGKSAPTPSSS